MKSVLSNLKNGSWIRTLSTIHFQRANFPGAFQRAEQLLGGQPSPPNEEAFPATCTQVPFHDCPPQIGPILTQGAQHLVN